MTTAEVLPCDIAFAVFLAKCEAMMRLTPDKWLVDEFKPKPKQKKLKE